MVLEHQVQPISVAEYFRLEENEAGICYEYVDGYAEMMPGGSFNHDAIKANIQGLIWNLLRKQNQCHVYTSDVRTQVTVSRYYHPDVVISCDPRDQGTGDLLKYPRVVVEVLSPSTEMKDRTRKMRDYLALPTLEEYLLVDSRAYRIELFRREPDKWGYYIFGLEDELQLTSIEAHLSVAEIYERVSIDLSDTENEEE